MKCPEEVIEYMHELLDEEISPKDEQLLQKHLDSCRDCKIHFQQLKKVISLVQCTNNIQAPANFTAKVIANLPKQNKQEKMKQWMQFHPFLTAASFFIVLMAGGLISSWQKDHEFSVSNQSNLVVQNNVVTVPKGEIVQGDVLVRNGELRVEGEIQGNVTVINGDQFVASAGHVTGEIEEVNKVFDWLWYQMKKASKNAISLFNNDRE